MLKSCICTIGDEILIGQIVDTNSSMISQALNSIGVKVQSMISIADDHDEIIEKLDYALRSNDIVIVTGGLGPTKDDITKVALAQLYGTKEFVSHKGQLEIIESLLSKRNIPLNNLNILQASIPLGSEVILNNNGTAPGLVFNFKKEIYEHKPVLYSLPGVPFETKAMLPTILDSIAKSNDLQPIIHKTIFTFGLGESILAERIEQWEDSLPSDMHLAYLPNPSIGVRLRLSIYKDEENNALDRIEKEFENLKPLLGNIIYGEDESSLQIAIANLLLDNKLTLSIAESCTGGKISESICSSPGASQYYRGSVTSYDNSIKESVLGVSSEIIQKYGAVSKECAEAMALGVLGLMKTDFSVATTGIAGPSGGTETKPVGTLWVACAYIDKTGQNQTISRTFNFSGTRVLNMERFAANALNFLRLALINYTS